MTTKPTVHLNGSSRETLQKAYNAQLEAINDCIAKLKENNVLHARDYYVKGDNEFNKASFEQTQRFMKLYTIREELTEIVESLEA